MLKLRANLATLRGRPLADRFRPGFGGRSASQAECAGQKDADRPADEGAVKSAAQINAAYKQARDRADGSANKNNREELSRKPAHA